MRIERRAAGALLVLLLAGAGAGAQERPWNLSAGVNLGHDDNLFRAPPGEEVGSQVRGATLGGRLALTLGRQQLLADASVRENRYSARSDLDHTGYAARLGWNGSTAGNLSWSLGAEANRRLAAYSSVREAQQRVANIESSWQAQAGLQLGLVGRWTAGLNLSHRELEYSAEVFASEAYRQDSVALTATWQPLGPLSASAGPRFTRGRLPQARRNADGSFDADGFDRTDLDLAINWAASGASTLSARLSVTRQRYTLLSDRDFDGATGQLGWRWMASGKTTFNAALSRDTGSETSFFTLNFLGEPLRGTGDNSTLTSTLTLGIDHAASAKIGLYSNLRHARRRLAASSVLPVDGAPVDLGSAAGSDRATQFSLGARWAPTPRSALGCEWSRALRSATTTLSSDYRASTVGCNARLSLR